MDIKGTLILPFLFLSLVLAQAQESTNHSFSKTILDTEGQAIIGANIYWKNNSNKGSISDSLGYFEIIFRKKDSLIISALGFQSLMISSNEIQAFTEKNIVLETDRFIMETANINSSKTESISKYRLKSIEGTALYASKKTEKIELKSLTADLASNNARQVLGRVPGLTIWESDAAGLQIGVGARGLSPNRNSNFNTRQNGYDIAADALGYPESYYSPPMQAIERIEIVRGAAGLQYGTQFGGMINLVLKSAESQKKIQLSHNSNYNSLGFYNTYTDVGLNYKKWSFFSYFNYRNGSGARDNTDFDALHFYSSAHYKYSKKLDIKLEFTHMNYLAQQAGGLTDKQFEQDPFQSLRSRNWFRVHWNLFAAHLDYKPNQNNIFNLRVFGLSGSRDALGFLKGPNRADNEPYENRDLLKDQYQNIGLEGRYLKKYKLKKLPSAFLIGSRLYHGNTQKQQGFGSNSSDADFNFLTENRNLLSDYSFPSFNAAVFTENVFNLSNRLSITPGLRFDYINTNADGYYDSSIRFPGSGEIFLDSSTFENREQSRGILLAGIGASYFLKEHLELYSNISMNYRAITFNNLRVVAPSYDIDPDLQDERGFNFELGLRGKLWKGSNIDAGIFALNYSDKIGSVIKLVDDPFFGRRIIRYTTNLADALIYGSEIFLNQSWSTVLEMSDRWNFDQFFNLAIIEGSYYKAQEQAVQGNQVENIPLINFRTGVSLSYNKFKTSVQLNYLSQQYSDATNAEQSADGIYGIIPEYWVADISFEYSYKKLKCQAGINNFLNTTYFTRRAVGYPGPGIIPSAPINFYFGLGIEI